jgi:hypothetical protein
MRERELEKKLGGLPLKKMRKEFRDSLSQRMKDELRPSESPEFPQSRWIFALNSVLIILIVISLWFSYPPSPVQTIETASAKPDAAIIEAGKDFYCSRSLFFLANSLKSGEQSLVPIKEVQL